MATQQLARERGAGGMAPPERADARAVAGFALGAALFVAVDGYLIAGAVGGAAGALLGAVLGAGLAMLALRPRSYDASTARATPEHDPRYMLIWGVLFLLTAVEVSVAFVALPRVAIILTLLVLAVWKAVLVALYYMHLRFEPRRMWLLAASPLPLAVILVWTVLYEGWR